MRRLRLAIAIVLALTGCGEAVSTSDHDGDAGPTALAEEATPLAAPGGISSSPARRDPVATAPRRTFERPAAGDSIAVPEGSLRVGSLPGRSDRRPSVEADLTPVTLPAYDIDRLPYPNDPALPVRMAATRAEAAGLCAARGRRLCDELEWERACRGDGVDSFATGEALDLDACVNDPLACPSSLGVLDMGFRAPEWTASDAEPRLARLERTAVVRGGRPDSSPASHRCGSRHVKAPAGGGRALAFRCCGGDAHDLAYPDVGLRRLYRDFEADEVDWRAVLASVPELARFATDFEPFGERSAARALSRGHATEAEMQWELTSGPFAWSPSPGEEVFVVAGRGGGASLLAALYPMPDGSFRHAASFVFAEEEEEAPIAILRTRVERGELQWSTCWSCGGENGVVRFDEMSRIVISQR